ncbi:MAG TPA: 2OG-Fe(II) oxygenase family protein [Gammaproteobacteria bacterium]|nr:2OG-Fe(II) oxygenase family protein [Gammaproteobacteria bacterium]
MIPIIDLQPLFSNETRGIQKIAAEIYQAYSTLGFAQVINHQVPQQIITDVYTASRDFHNLTLEEKNQIKYKAYLRGYLPINIQKFTKSDLGAAKKPNQSESFMLCSEPHDARWQNSILGGKQVWPKQLPQFKNQVLNYYWALEKLSQKLIRAFSLALDLPADYLDKYFTDPSIFLRLLYYPPISKNAPSDLFSAAPHTDYGFLTLLHQDEIGGLQVQVEGDKWIDVTPRSDALVLNTGQMIVVWSNGRLKATPHRVINASSDKPRYSIPYFYGCNLSTLVAPLPSCVSAANPPHFEPIAYGEHLEEMFLANYAFGK